MSGEKKVELGFGQVVSDEDDKTAEMDQKDVINRSLNQERFSKFIEM